MRRSVAATFLLLLVFLIGGVLLQSRGPKGAVRTRAGVTLIGVGTLSGNASDRSGLTGATSKGMPHNRLGGLGSAIAYTGHGNEYLLASDSGPKRGPEDEPFACRVHRMTICVALGAKKPVTLGLIDTMLLRTGDKSFVGAPKPAKPEKHLPLDPEGVRVGRGGEIYVSDEYGPVVCRFDEKSGRHVKSFAVPKHFRSRQENRGMEGLAISPDGTKLHGAMQSPLVRDGGREIEKGKREGVNCRILEIDLANDPAREFVYRLDHPLNSVSEILAVNDTAFLVLERDNLGANAACKKVFRIDLADATEVSRAEELPAAVTPVKKALFLDLLAAEYGIAGADCPEKFEGLAFGPDLPDGRHLLLVTVDNDFDPAQPFRVYAFAIDPAALPDFRPQQFDPK